MLNPRKRSDNRRDALISKKNPNQADISELFLSRTTDKFTVKRGIGNFVALATETFVNNLVNPILALISALPAAPTTVNITSAQILAMGTTPVPTLPILDTGQYYTGNVTLEVYPSTIPYTLPSGSSGIKFVLIIGGEFVLAEFDASSLVDGLYSITTNTLSYNNTDSFNESQIELVSLTDLGEQSLENGNGTARLIFETQTRTFGA